MSKEYNNIIGFSKHFIGKESLLKIKKVEDDHDRIMSLKYLINAKLRLILLDMESQVSLVDKKESLILEAKIRRLASKIKIFHSTYTHRDFLVVEDLIKEIKEEIKNVRVW